MQYHAKIFKCTIKCDNYGIFDNYIKLIISVGKYDSDNFRRYEHKIYKKTNLPNKSQSSQRIKRTKNKIIFEDNIIQEGTRNAILNIKTEVKFNTLKNIVIGEGIVTDLKYGDIIQINENKIFSRYYVSYSNIVDYIYDGEKWIKLFNQILPEEFVMDDIIIYEPYMYKFSLQNYNINFVEYYKHVTNNATYDEYETGYFDIKYNISLKSGDCKHQQKQLIVKIEYGYPEFIGYADMENYTDIIVEILLCNGCYMSICENNIDIYKCSIYQHEIGQFYHEKITKQLETIFPAVIAQIIMKYF